MRENWKLNPPYSNWNTYAPNFDSYIDNQLKNTIEFSEPSEFRTWLESRLPMLHNNRYMRKHNRVVARHLYPMAKQDPEFFWSAIVDMNVNAEISNGFDDYISGWERSTSNSSFVSNIAGQMGF